MRAQPLDSLEVVADEDHGAAFPRHVVHLAETLPLERGVADGEHLVDQQDLRLEVRRDGEGEAQVHAARVVLHRRVDERLDFGERDDLVELARGSRARFIPRMAPFRKTFSRPVSSRMKAGADLEQRADAPAQLHRAGRRLRDARQDLEQRALAGAVRSDQAERGSARDIERHVPKRPEEGSGSRVGPAPHAGGGRAHATPSDQRLRGGSDTPRGEGRGDSPFPHRSGEWLA